MRNCARHLLVQQPTLKLHFLFIHRWRQFEIVVIKISFCNIVTREFSGTSNFHLQIMGLFASKSPVDLELSLEVAKYENSVLKRALDQKSRELRRYKRIEKPMIDTFMIDSTQPLKDIIKQKYLECETYKQQLAVFVKENHKTITTPHLVPVLDTCNSDKINMASGRSAWSPITSTDQMTTDSKEWNQLKFDKTKQKTRGPNQYV